MEYDSIILELMSRIQKLEEEVAQLKASASTLPKTETPAHRDVTASYQKTTEAMIDCCYTYGKKAYEQQVGDLWQLVPEVQQETGMNGNSAYIYLYVVKALLEGSIYKRAINVSASRKYLDRIGEEYGPEGLRKALSAMEQHIAYRKSLGHPIDSLENLYREYRTGSQT